jgi:formate hydrogenlyase subunit 4
MDIILQLMQVLTVFLLSPLLEGIVLQVESRITRGKGISIFQPYRDLWKLFHKQLVLPEGASWIFIIIPIIAMAVMFIVPMIIPIVANFPLPLGAMGDILGGGFLLGLGGFVILLAGLEIGNSFGSMGSSRIVLINILSEPVMLLTLVGIAVFSKDMTPYNINHYIINNPILYWSPAHILLTVSFFIILLYETGRMPAHSHSKDEIFMLDESRVLEYSGPLLAILKWASMMKQFIFYTLFINMLLIPWYLSTTHNVGWAFVAIAIIFVKYTLVVCAVVTVDTMQARLRFFRYQEPLIVAFICAVLAIIISKLGAF